jgi:NAD(P)-dependent dehydrogenase (short-subunit alcohol dehydrogenase family)
MNLFDLTGKTAIVTGACGLIGQKHCAALAEAGANVVVADLNAEAAAAVAFGLGGGPHLSVAVDVTSPDSLAAARDQILARFGHIDVLVNNAAINSKFENFPLATFQKVLEVNVTGVFLAAQVFGTPMAQQGHGSIINVASTYGIVGPDQSIYRNEAGEQTFYKSPSYPMTKGAVVNFTRYLAAYWGQAGVRVNTLSPGGVENSQDEFFIKQYSAKTPLGRMATPTDYQGAVVFLASEASAYMTGANLVVDGGWTAI